MIKIKQDIANGSHGIGTKFIYDYTHHSLPKLQELIDTSSYDKTFAKFIRVSEKYLSELKANSTGIIKSERISIKQPLVTATESNDKKRDAS